MNDDADKLICGSQYVAGLYQKINMLEQENAVLRAELLEGKKLKGETIDALQPVLTEYRVGYDWRSLIAWCNKP